MARLCKSAKIVAYYQKRFEPFSSDVLDIPPQVSHVWSWFWKLDQARQGSVSGMQSLTYTDISTWSGLVGETLHKWEVYAIMDVDLVYRKAMAPEPSPDERGTRQSVSAYDGAAALRLFDKMTESRNQES